MGYFDDPGGADPMTGATPDEAAGYLSSAWKAYQNLIQRIPSMGDRLAAASQWRPGATPEQTAAATNSGFDLAQSVGPGIIAGPRGAAMRVPMYGKIAQTTLDDAVDMHLGGAGRDDIYTKTGWWRGPDNKFRFEIPDSFARGKEMPAGTEAARLDTVVDHPYFAKTYPDLIRGTDVRFGQTLQNPGAYAEYTSPWNGAPGRIDFASKPDQVDPVTSRISDTQLNVLLHEMQHAVQGREGFAQGISPSVYQRQFVGFDPTSVADWNFRSATGAQKSNAGSAKIITDPKLGQVTDVPASDLPQHLDEAREYLKAMGIMPETAYDRYWRTAGEVEARNVQARQHFGTMFRETRPPWKTQSVADKDQIIDPNSFSFLQLDPTPGTVRLLEDPTAPRGWGSAGALSVIPPGPVKR